MKSITKSVFLIIAIFTWTLQFSFSSAKTAGKSPGYEIKVHVKGLKEADTVFLARYYADKRYYQDTALADAKGNVVFADTNTLKEGMYFLLLPGQKVFDFIMNPSSFSISLDESDLIKTAQFKNSPDNSAFYAYQNYFIVQKAKADSLNSLYKSGDAAQKAAVSKQLASIDSSMLNYIQTFIKDHPQNLFSAILKTTREVEMPPAPKTASGAIDSVWQYRYYKKHYFDNVDFTDSRLLRTPVLASKVDSYFKNLVVQRPDSIIKEVDMILTKCQPSKDLFEHYVREFTYKYETSQVMGMDAVFVHLGKEYYLKGKCFWTTPETLVKIKDRVDILDPLLLGKKAPNLFMTDTNGIYTYLHNVQAKYTILFFWDSQCGHCQKETPKLYAWWLKNKRDSGICRRY